MNIYLLDLFGKWISFLFIGIASLFNLTDLTEEQVQMKLDNNLHVSVINETIDYEIIKKYNNKIPINKTQVLQEGVTGIIHKNPDGEVVQVLRESKPEIIEIGTGKIGEFTGRITGYGADCYGCSGQVYCPDANRKYHHLVKDGENYIDDEYGEVRILAGARDLFECGTIITVDSPRSERFIGIILDTGGDMNKAWTQNGEVWIDLAHESQSGEGKKRTFAVTSDNVKYSVERWGW